MKYIKKNNKIAFTVIELLIVIFLFGLFLSAIGTICVQGVKAFHRSRNKLVTQQEAQLSIDRLCRELNESYEPGVRIKKSFWNGGDPNEVWDAVCFPTSRNSDDASGTTTMSNGKLQWNKYVVYFKRAGSKEVYRRVIQVTGYPVNPLYPEPVPDEDMADFLNPSYPVGCPPAYSVTSGTITDDRKIAREIYNIEFDLYNPSLVSVSIPVVHITVEARVKTGTDPNGQDLFERTILTTDVKPENR
jgi:hypothetical protein